MRSRRFTFPDGCSIREVVVREINGLDQRKAFKMAEVTGGTNLEVMEEMVRLAIVEVDGQAVTQPYTEVSSWNSRTLQLLTLAFNELNQATDSEAAAFLAAGKECEAEPRQSQPPIASVSGSK